MTGRSSMEEISRDPPELVRPDAGAASPISRWVHAVFAARCLPRCKDRDAPGQGFTHHLGDSGESSPTPQLGELSQRGPAGDRTRPEWTFGTGALMRNLAARGLV